MSASPLSVVMNANIKTMWIIRRCGLSADADANTRYISSMLYKIRFIPVHPINGALHGLYVPVRVTCGAPVTRQFTNVLPRCRTLQHCRTFIPLSVSLWNDLASPVFDGVGMAGFKSRADAFLLA